MIGNVEFRTAKFLLELNKNINNVDYSMGKKKINILIRFIEEIQTKYQKFFH